MSELKKPKKIADSVKAVFTKDFVKGGKVIYKAGETHFPLKKVADKLGFKDYAKISAIDWEKGVEAEEELRKKKEKEDIDSSK